MDCPECGGIIELEVWEIWEGLGICKDCKKEYAIEIRENKRNE